MLAISQLRKSYGNRAALDGASLTIAAGEICALLGPNGAGKSTMVSIVAGLLRPDSGSVTVNGVDAVAHRELAQRHLGLAGQDLAVYPTISVRDNLTMFGQLVGLRRRELTDRITHAAERMSLTHLLDRAVRHLSGGEKRRLHTAVALLGRPPLLLLDEPTAGVDVTTRARMVAAIRQLAAEEGCAVCYSTHYLGEVEDLGASVAVLDHGRVIARGAIDELVRAHARSAVELVFDGPPPLADLRVGDDSAAVLDTEVDGTTVRIYGERPAAIAARVLTTLDAERGGLHAVQFVAPSLESVFLSLTGRRFAAESDVDGAESDLDGAEVTGDTSTVSAGGTQASRGGSR